MRRLLRFRLRSFFLLIALLGILVYPIAAEWQAVRREQAAIGTFRAPSAIYEPAQSPIARWVAVPLWYIEPLAGMRVQRLTIAQDWTVPSSKAIDLRPVQALVQLKQLEINDGLVAQPVEQYQILSRSLQTLVLRHSNRHEHLRWLRGLPSLQSLAIRQSELSTLAIESIAQAKPRSLEISGYDLPAGGLSSLAGNKGLQTLRLYGGPALEAPRLLAALPYLESLTVDRSWRGNSDPHLLPLHAIPLKELIICNTALRAEDAKRLALSTSLRELELRGAKLTAEAASHLQAIPNLRRLSCTASYVDADAWPELGQLSQLRYLELRGVVTSAKYFDCLRSLTELEDLELHHGRLDDAAAQILISLPVKRVTLRHVVMTPRTRQWLEAQRQGPALTMVN